MANSDFTTRFHTTATPQQAYDTICNVAAWWCPEFSGKAQNAGDVFSVRFGDLHYSVQQLTEAIPGKRIVWEVTESNLTFLSQPDEWTGSRIQFDISAHDGNTIIHFTHLGLRPGIECYDACSGAWGQYIAYSLISMLNGGKGQPGFPPAGPLA